MSVLDLFDLHGKRALITGASTGIGKRVALAYVEAGAQVAIAARHLDALEKLADEIGTSGGKVVPVCCDVSQHQQVTSMLDQVTAELGGIDIAVCNAGIITVTPMLDMPLEEFQRLQNTNVTGVFLTAQAAAKAMVKQGQGGASKAAVIHLTKAMAVELAPHKIRVNSVSPGYILTELVEPYTEYQPLWEPKIPLGRLGRPEELAGLYLYLASEASSYMTGSDIVIDGGYTCP